MALKSAPATQLSGVVAAGREIVGGGSSSTVNTGFTPKTFGPGENIFAYLTPDSATGSAEYDIIETNSNVSGAVTYTIGFNDAASQWQITIRNGTSGGVSSFRWKLYIISAGVG